MSCAHPLHAWWSKKPNPVTGKYYPVFSVGQAHPTKTDLWLPCGKCYLCRLRKSFEWSVRCTCESYFHSECYFITLTYDKDNLPADRNLNRAHFQSFMKRLRWHFRGYTIKVFYCGEYGDKRNRPHYHAILFGLPLSELGYKLSVVNYSKRRNPNYSNPVISKLWGKGLVTIGSFSSSAASYVAQYTLKKAKYNERCSKRVPPFVGMSLRKPIGYSFFKRYYKDIFPRNGFYSSMGDKSVFVRPFRFFQRLLEKEDLFLYWKYVERPARRVNRFHVLKHLISPVTIPLTESKRRVNLLLRNERLMRSYSQRLDL